MTTCPHCGCEIALAANSKVPRSPDQHRRYFALINSAYHHWPESHERQFSSAEEFRAWVQMKSGHREIGAQIPISRMKPDHALVLAEAAIKAAGSYAVPAMHGNVLVVWRPKSISFSKLGHLDFCRLNDAVADVIKAEIGLTADELLQARDAA